MHIPWEDLEVFLAVTEQKSFSGAARQLGLTQPTVSRRIGALEERLQRALFRRDVEGAHLTDEGAKLEPAALQMARFAKELEQVATDFDDRPAGVVRIATPPGTALDFIVPFARDLRKALPDIRVHAISDVDYLDISRGHAELALRAKPPTNPDLMVVGQARIQLGVFASKSYQKRLTRRAERRGTTGRLALSDVDWICWAYPNEHLEPTPTLQQRIEGFAPIFAANDYNVQTRAVAEGIGAMILPKTNHKDSPYPPFIELDIDFPLPPADMYLVCAKTMRWVPRVRAVVRELLQALTQVEGVTIVESASM